MYRILTLLIGLFFVVAATSAFADITPPVSIDTHVTFLQLPPGSAGVNAKLVYDLGQGDAKNCEVTKPNALTLSGYFNAALETGASLPKGYTCVRLRFIYGQKTYQDQWGLVAEPGVGYIGSKPYTGHIVIK